MIIKFSVYSNIVWSAHLVDLHFISLNVDFSSALVFSVENLMFGSPSTSKLLYNFERITFVNLCCIQTIKYMFILIIVVFRRRWQLAGTQMFTYDNSPFRRSHRDSPDWCRIPDDWVCTSYYQSTRSASLQDIHSRLYRWSILKYIQHRWIRTEKKFETLSW